MAFDPDAFLAESGGVATAPAPAAFDPDAFLAEPFDPDKFLASPVKSSGDSPEITGSTIDPTFGVSEDAIQEAITNEARPGLWERINEPAIKLPRIEQQEGALKQAGAGIVNAGAGLVESLTSELGSASLLLGGAPALAQKAAALGFGAHMIKSGSEAIGEAETLQQGVEAAAGTGLGALAIAHAASRPLAGGATKAERQAEPAAAAELEKSGLPATAEVLREEPEIAREVEKMQDGTNVSLPPKPGVPESDPLRAVPDPERAVAGSADTGAQGRASETTSDAAKVGAPEVPKPTESVATTSAPEIDPARPTLPGEARPSPVSETTEPARPAASPAQSAPVQEPRPAVEPSKSSAFPESGRTVESEQAARGGPGAMSPQEAAEMQAARTTTSTKNAVMEAEREARGADPILQEARVTNAETLDKAEAAVEANPNRGKEVVAKLNSGESVRNISAEEEAILLVEKTRLRNERDLQADRASDANATPEERAVARQEWETLEAQINEMDQATHASGAEWGRLGQFRQRMLRDDFTFEAMERRARVQKGEALTPEESAKIKEQATRIADLEKQLAEKQKTTAEGDATRAADEATKKLTDEAGKANTTDRVNGKKPDLDAQREQLADGIRKRVADGDSLTDLRAFVQKLALNLVRSGVKERDVLVTRVHEILAKIVPDIAPGQTRDLISGYGDFKALDNEAAKVTLRGLKGEMQQLGKIADMQAKVAPKKTGVERRTPTDEERRLIKEVNELKKKGGFVVTDPARQLKTAQDAIRTRLTNEIRDLDNAIASKQPLVSKKAGDLPYDAEMQALKARRDALKTQYEELFPKAGMGDAQRLAMAGRALDRSIVELEGDLKSGKLYPDPAAPRLTSPEIEAKRLKLDALKAERELLRDLDTATIEATREKALQDRIATLQDQIAKGEIAPKTGTPTVDTAAVAKLKAERAALNRQLADLRRGPKKTPEQIAIQAYKTRTAHRIAELQDRMARGDFAPKAKKAPPVKDAAASKLAFELNAAKQEFTRGLFDWQLKNRSVPQKILGGVRDTLNTARAVMTSFDLSAVLRQGGFVTLGNPVRAARAVPAMFKALVSKQKEFEINSEILARPNASLYQQAKLYLHDANDPRLSKMEEAYMSRWSERIPGVAASQRAYTTFLNRLRADSFDAMAGAFKDGGMTPDEAKVIANYVNVATGRGNLGAAGQAAVALNTAFFSPRYLASRFQLLAGQPLYGGTARTRKLVAMEYAKFLAGVGVVYALGQAGGADDPETDPTDADFGKIKFGDTRVDPLAGLAQVTRFEAQFAENIAKVFKGEKLQYGAGDFTGRFLRSKLSPIFGSGVDLAYGSNMIGEQVTPAGLAGKLIVPMSVGEIVEAMQEQGIPRGSAIALLALLGWGVQTYEEREKKK